MNLLSPDILRLIAEYATDDIYELDSDIPYNELNWNGLSANPRAIHFLKANPHKVDLRMLCDNPSLEVIPLIEAILQTEESKIKWNWLLDNPILIHLLALTCKIRDINNWWKISKCEHADAIQLLKNNIDKIDYYWLSGNQHPDAVKLLETLSSDKITKICWYSISKNPNAMDLIESNPAKVRWSGLSANINDRAIKLLEANLEKINWFELSSNPSAIKLLKSHPDKIYHNTLSFNPNPDVIPLLEAIPPNKINWDYISRNSNPKFIDFIESHITDCIDEINWYSLSKNPYAISLLKAHIDKIEWWGLCENPNPEIFDIVVDGHIDKVNWSYLSENACAIPFLKTHLNEVHWLQFSKLPDIFIIKEDINTITQTLNILCKVDTPE